MTELSILMPVYNERETVERAIQDVLEADLPADGVELVVVDDGSTDGTREILRRGDWGHSVRVFEHDRNRGKGAAVRTALAEASGRWSTIMDADLEYSPESLADLLAPLTSGYADAVYGTRAFTAHSAFSFWYVVGNKAVSFACNVLFNTWLSDIMTCHKIMSTELFRSLDLRERGFGIEPEITARLLQGEKTIFEVPVPYRARKREDGKKLTATDGFRTLRTLTRCRVTKPAHPTTPRRRPSVEPSPTPGSRTLAEEPNPPAAAQSNGSEQQGASAGTA